MTVVLFPRRTNGTIAFQARGGARSGRAKVPKDGGRAHGTEDPLPHMAVVTFDLFAAKYTGWAWNRVFTVHPCSHWLRGLEGVWRSGHMLQYATDQFTGTNLWADLTRGVMF